MRGVLETAYVGGCVLGLFWWWTVGAYSHEAPLGWRYDGGCCSNVDCRQVSDDAISERPDGYLIKVTGEVIAYNDSRIHDSKDQFFHWCTMDGTDKTKTRCLYRPPRGF